MQTAPKAEPKKQVVSGFEYEVPQGEGYVNILCLDNGGKQIKISFRPLEKKFLEQHREMFARFGLKNLAELYDKPVLTDIVKRFGVSVIPLDSEPPLNYQSPEDVNNGKVEVKGLTEQAEIFNVTTDTLANAYRTAQQVYAKEILKI